jgi:hypothetical protein
VSGYPESRCARSAGTIILKCRLERPAPAILHAQQRLRASWTQSAVMAERGVPPEGRCSARPAGSQQDLPGMHRYTQVMADDAPGADAVRGRDEVRELPRHLAVLIGALTGPSDLGRNHDKYLAYPDRDEASGAASA